MRCGQRVFGCLKRLNSIQVELCERKWTFTRFLSPFIHPHSCSFDAFLSIIYFFSAAYEGSVGLCRDVPACSVQSAGPDCFLPGARDQRHPPELLFGPEGPAECALPVRILPGWGRRGETLWLQADGGRPVLENGKFSIFELGLLFFKSWKEAV